MFVFLIFGRFLGLDSMKVLNWNFGSSWGGSANGQTDLGGFRQRKNGQQDNNEEKTANTDVCKRFGMLEYCTHCKNLCFGPTLCPNMSKFRGCCKKTIQKHCKNGACSKFLQGPNPKRKTCGAGGPPREAGWMTHKLYCNRQMLNWTTLQKPWCQQNAIPRTVTLLK